MIFLCAAAVILVTAGIVRVKLLPQRGNLVAALREMEARRRQQVISREAHRFLVAVRYRVQQLV